MQKKPNGKEMADKLFRKLERLYEVKIVDSRLDDCNSGNLSMRLYHSIENTVQAMKALEHSLARLPPVPQRPRRVSEAESRNDVDNLDLR
jgi:hypothetical protein